MEHGFDALAGTRSRRFTSPRPVDLDPSCGACCFMKHAARAAGQISQALDVLPDELRDYYACF